MGTYYQNHIEERKAYQRKYYLSHFEECLFRTIAWQKANPERVYSYQKKYSRNYYRKNRDRLIKNSITWQRANPGRVRVLRKIQKHTRRIRMHDGVGSFTYNEWNDLKTKYENKCPSCGRCEPEIKLTVDHIVPISKGGTNMINNIQPLCMGCNGRKHTQSTKY